MAHPSWHEDNPQIRVYHPDLWPGCRDCLEAEVAKHDRPTAERRRDLRATAALTRLESTYNIPVRWKARHHRKNAAA